MENNYQQTKNSSTLIIPKTSALAKFPLVSGRELAKQNKSIDWLLKNVIERQSLNLLFGAPASGKSLLALEWAFCIASGINWYDLRVKQAGVIYIAGEGHAGLGRRLKALEHKYQIETPEGLVISEKPAEFLSPDSSKSVAASILELKLNPGLIVIDTLHRNFNGDENSSKDIGKFISNLDNILKPLGAAILVIHHSGHNEDKRGRGSSSIKGAMDAEFSTSKQGTTSLVDLKCHKSKDFEPLKSMIFQVMTAELGCDEEEGEDITSAYLRYLPNESTDKKQKLTGNEKTALACLTDLLEKEGIAPTEEQISSQSVLKEIDKLLAVDSWKISVDTQIQVKSTTPEKEKAAKKKAFDRIRNKLANLGKIGLLDDFVFLPKVTPQEGTKDKNGQDKT